LRSVSAQWQAHRHRRAHALNAGNRDRAAVLFHDATAPPQAQPGARDATLHVAAAVEALEDVRQVIRGNADAFITDGDYPDSAHFPLLARNVGTYGPTSGAVLDGVRQQVLQ